MDAGSPSRGVPAERDLPESLRHLYDGDADPTPPAASDDLAGERAPQVTTGADGTVDIDRAEDHAPAPRDA